MIGRRVSPNVSTAFSTDASFFADYMPVRAATARQMRAKGPGEK
jgi:hypothetical protein